MPDTICAVFVQLSLEYIHGGEDGELFFLDFHFASLVSEIKTYFALLSVVSYVFVFSICLLRILIKELF